MPLKPQEYYYLYSPRRAVPEEMFKYTVESLVLEGHLNYYYKAIYIHSNADRKRNRLFLCLGKSYNPKHNYSVAERFVLSLFEEQQELRPYEIRLKALDKLNDNIDEFRTLYVYQDIQTLGYCWLRIFLTSAGRKAKKDYARLIETLENNTNTLLKTPDVLQAHLKALGTGIVLVDDAAIKTLKLTVPKLKEMRRCLKLLRAVAEVLMAAAAVFMVVAVAAIQVAEVGEALVAAWAAAAALAVVGRIIKLGHFYSINASLIS